MYEIQPLNSFFEVRLVLEKDSSLIASEVKTNTKLCPHPQNIVIKNNKTVWINFLFLIIPTVYLISIISTANVQCNCECLMQIQMRALKSITQITERKDLPGSYLKKTTKI